ncbi:MAG: UbiA family prenyltransferase [Methanoregula sp.]|nr:MAG: UbiA family prenyltransferase [Methanoregula sp.]
MNDSPLQPAEDTHVTAAAGAAAPSPDGAPDGFVPVLKAYADLTRIHFFFAWPLLFCSGLMLAAAAYGTFSWWLLFKGALIGFFGFEAGLVLNDYIDRDYDRRDIENYRLTKYWRLFGNRPIPAGFVTPQAAFRLFALLFVTTLFLVATLPFPNCLFVFAIMLFSYAAEVFYQIKKRHQSFPVSQLVGRMDFALFPVAGYLCAGYPDGTALAYFVFFYPFAMAHLGANDLIDIANDRARELRTIPLLYGINGTVYWIAGFTLLHAVAAALMFHQIGTIARGGILIGLFLMGAANVVILQNRDPDTAMKVLPLFHITMVIYAGSLILDSAIRIGLF